MADQNPEKDSFKVMKFLIDYGYEIFPVNPNEINILGRKCYSSMKKIEDSYRRIFMLDYFENVNPQIVNVGNATNIDAIIPPNTIPKLGADRKLPNPPAEPSTKRA